MKQMMKTMFMIVVFLTATVLSAQAAVSVGDAAPALGAVDTNGEMHSLAVYKGKYVVLEWFNSGCPFVKKHYDGGNMQKLQKTYTGKGVIWLSICSSAPGKQGHMSIEEANQWRQEQGASPTGVILDPGGDIGRLYGAKTTPHMFVIDPEGTLIYQGAIDSVAGTDPSEIDGAENYVGAALDAAMNGKLVATPSTKSYGCSVKY